jgi:hypothetical protein
MENELFEKRLREKWKLDKREYRKRKRLEGKKQID